MPLGASSAAFAAASTMIDAATINPVNPKRITSLLSVPKETRPGSGNPSRARRVISVL